MEGRTVIEPCPHTLHFLGFHTGLGYVIPCHTTALLPRAEAGAKAKAVKNLLFRLSFFFFLPPRKNSEAASRRPAAAQQSTATCRRLTAAARPRCNRVCGDRRGHGACWQHAGCTLRGARSASAGGRAAPSHAAPSHISPSARAPAAFAGEGVCFLPSKRQQAALPGEAQGLLPQQTPRHPLFQAQGMHTQHFQRRDASKQTSPPPTPAGLPRHPSPALARPCQAQ